MKQGIYGITMRDYVLDNFPSLPPTLSASVAHTLIALSPSHAFEAHPRLNAEYEHEEDEKFDIGSAAHTVLLENNPGLLHVVDAPDWRKKAAREERDLARESGFIPVLSHHEKSILKMAELASRAIARSADLCGGLEHGSPERTIVWNDGGVWCRSRPDWVANDNSLILDYKTTNASAEPDSWIRGPMLGNGCDIQAAMQVRALSEVAKLAKNPRHVFVVQETSAPYAVSFVGTSPTMLAMGMEKFEFARRTWKECLDSKQWPGYTDRVCWAEPPDYAWSNWQERMSLEAMKKEIVL